LEPACIRLILALVDDKYDEWLSSDEVMYRLADVKKRTEGELLNAEVADLHLGFLRRSAVSTRRVAENDVVVVYVYPARPELKWMKGFVNKVRQSDVKFGLC
jgi:hypothetical protein